MKYKKLSSSRRLRRVAWITATAVVGTLAIVACSDRASHGGQPMEVPLLDPQLSPGEAEALLAEFRDCDGSTSIYTVDATRAVSMGEGGSKQDAITDTIQNAIKDDVSEQFECNDCPGEFPEPCDRKWGTIAMGGAELEDEDKNCEQIDGTWYCFDWVNFDSSAGNQSWAQAGCKKCDEIKVRAVPEAQQF